MTGAIVDLSREALPESFATEILIIGSGSSGATAARLLGEAGHEVVVLDLYLYGEEALAAVSDHPISSTGRR